jgi:hypothetical protein
MVKGSMNHRVAAAEQLGTGLAITQLTWDPFQMV